VLRLLLFTGARKTEILALRWSEIDWAARRIVLTPDRSKTGGKVGERRIPLSDAALEVLHSMPRTADYVFPGGRRSTNHTTGLHKVWCDIRIAAGFPRLRVHDLRHSFASLALANNENLYLISRVLGHTTTRMTERYLHANDSDLQALVQRTTAMWAKVG
jgi:integrase